MFCFLISVSHLCTVGGIGQPDDPVVEDDDDDDEDEDEDDDEDEKDEDDVEGKLSLQFKLFSVLVLALSLRCSYMSLAMQKLALLFS